MISLLKERQDICLKIAKLKAQMNMPVFQPDRHRDVIELRKNIARQLGLNPDFIEKLWTLIMTDAIKCQEDLLKH
jgi:chorismate mutase